MDDRVTTEFLKLAHEEFMAAENGRINALKLWGRDFELKGGPEKWREHVDAIRKDPVAVLPTDRDTKK